MTILEQVEIDRQAQLVAATSPTVSTLLSKLAVKSWISEGIPEGKLIAVVIGPLDQQIDLLGE